MSQLSDALEAANLKILKYDISKQRQVSSDAGTMTVEKFCQTLLSRLGGRADEYPEISLAMLNISKAKKMIEDYARDMKILRGEQVKIEIPKDMEDLTLNLNLAAKSQDDKFFLTHEDETISEVSGDIYLMIHQIPPLEAASMARKVLPRYLPRTGAGISTIVEEGKEKTVYNTYRPPSWTKMSDKKILPVLPPLFEKLVKHLFPIPDEREYFYDWLHDSLFTRSYTFLILCGAPGTGKNRLKLVMRALHGHLNTVDGKKSTLSERFNSQLSEATLAWFDELHYDADMENNMKELQNDSISIERKGVDATRGTRIYSSIVISNNKPRDNYIAFDARKFAPLAVTSRRLEESMKPEHIDLLTKKVEDQASSSFDPEFLAQIIKWLRKRGNSKRWLNLEYRGPMFWTLAHTSMTRWQKKAISSMLEPDVKSSKWGYDEDLGMFKWSVMCERINRKMNDYKQLPFPDHTSVRAFFEVFRDGKGRKAFSTKSLKDENNILGDFWIKPLIEKMHIINEGDVIEKREKQKSKDKKEIYDL